MRKILLLTIVALMASIVTPLVLFAESTTTEKLRDFNTKKLEMLSYNYDISNLDGFTQVADNEKIGNSARKKNALKGYFTLGAALGYERALNEKSSLFIGANILVLAIADSVTYLYGLEIGPRFYLSKTKHEMAGWYIGVPLSFAYVETAVGTVKGAAFAGGLAISGGYQWIFPRGFAIDLGGNLGYGVGMVTTDLSSPELYASPAYRVYFGMGSAF